MDLSLPGMIGAALGLAIGWVDFKMIGGMVRAKYMQKRRDAGLADHPDTEKYATWIQFAIFALTVGLFPVIGYWAGTTLALG
ncbi:MAG: hypothetical protein N4A65_05310 [Cohaesibacter sp.]|jgi:hypothetical protein|nr:hypothetical protein [Cohaesibacter sp.]